MVTSLLTLLAVARVWARAFWRRPEDATRPDALITINDPERVKYFNKSLMSAGLMVPTIALIGVGLALTIFASSIFNFAGQAGRDIVLRTPYIEAVLGTEDGEGGSIGVVKEP